MSIPYNRIHLSADVLKILLISAAMALLFSGCGGGQALTGRGDAQKRFQAAFLLGGTNGGLVENSEMIELDKATGVDAISGATRKTLNAGVHTEINIKGHTIESGLDYLGFAQSITYRYAAAAEGQRDVRFYQLRLPLTYNFSFFKNERNRAALVVKAGFSLGYTLSKTITEQGNLPDYTFTNWDAGPTLGVALYPFPSWAGYRLGMYLDLYRGSRIYEDAYHKAEGLGGQSYLKFGIVLQPQF